MVVTGLALAGFVNPHAPLVVFFRVGALVFGGGPVVVPLLLTQLVGAGAAISHQHFLLAFAAVSLGCCNREQSE